MCKFITRREKKYINFHAHTFSSLTGSELVAAEMNSLCSESLPIDYEFQKEKKNRNYKPFIDDAAVLSAGKSNTQRSFESINWSGVTSFH